jgi:hypothetical protein
MSPRPSIIKVAPAQDTISIQTVEHEYQRTHDLKDYDFTITKPDELDQVDESKSVAGILF